MKYEVYVPKTPTPEAEKPEPVTYLALKRGSSGEVTLHAVDEDGVHIPGGNILRITSTGLYRFSGITPSIDLPRDGPGKITLDSGY